MMTLGTAYQHLTYDELVEEWIRRGASRANAEAQARLEFYMNNHADEIDWEFD